MKNICIVLLTIFIFTACLKAKKSPFDISTPTTGLIFGFAASFGSQTATTTGTTAGTGTGTDTVNNTFSVGGTITGFTTGTLVLQNNNTNDLTLSSAGNYSFSGLASGATYSISVKSHPTGLACTLTKAKGTISANITDAHINCAAATANALYTLGDATKSYWMDYVESNGTSPLNATGVGCIPPSPPALPLTRFYYECIHSGEFKKISIPNITSCDGITATDSLSAFNWRCVVATDSSVSVISTGLRGEKGLTDLIDFTSPGSFRTNFVTVLLNGNSLLTSATGKWWDNPIVVANDGGTMSVIRTIYIVNNSTSTNNTYSFSSGNHKMALLVQPGIVKPFVTGGSNCIDVNSNHFLWIEGNFSALNGDRVLEFNGSASGFNVIRKFKAIGSFSEIIFIASGSATASFFSDISGTNLQVTGGTFIASNNSKNIFNNLQAYNVSGFGISINNADNIIQNSLVMNTLNSPIKSLNTSNNLMQNISAVNSTDPPFNLEISNFTTSMNMLAANRGGGNGAITTIGASNSPKYINSIAAHAGTESYTESNTTSQSKFNGIFKVFPASCGSTGSTNPGYINTTCDKTGGSEINPQTVKGGFTLASSFVGKLSSDSKNANGATGSITSASITDWLNFENRFRGWGRQGSAFPNSDHTGRCTSGTCQIWDWSLKSTDTVARNVNACPNGTIVDTHQWSAATQTACNDFKGAVFTAGVNTCVTTFLRNAVEIFGDGVGNENGICESNEECLYTPNIGAYQGHSSDSTNTTKLIPASQSSTTTTTCPDVTTGTVSNVKLWKYDTNGY